MLNNAAAMQQLVEHDTFCMSFSHTSTDPPTANRNERKFVISIVPKTRSIIGPRALHQQAFYLVNLLHISAHCSRVHLLVAGKLHVTFKYN